MQQISRHARNISPCTHELDFIVTTKHERENGGRYIANRTPNILLAHSQHLLLYHVLLEMLNHGGTQSALAEQLRGFTFVDELKTYL